RADRYDGTGLWLCRQENPACGMDGRRQEGAGLRGWHQESDRGAFNHDGSLWQGQVATVHVVPYREAGCGGGGTGQGRSVSRRLGDSNPNASAPAPSARAAGYACRSVQQQTKPQFHSSENEMRNVRVGTLIVCVMAIGATARAADAMPELLKRVPENANTL